MKHHSYTRREFLGLVGAGSASLALTPSLVEAARNKRRPNVLVIIADDLGYHDLGCQGNTDIPTPNIDSLARDGVRFTDGYVSCPVCSPTRAGIYTGRYQQRFGHEFNPGGADGPDGNFGLPLRETTVATRLKAAGYSTGLVGKWHLGTKKGYRPMDRGFDEFFGFLGGAHPYMPDQPLGEGGLTLRGDEPANEKEYLTDAYAREAVAFIEKHKSEPFLLFLPFNAVHSPLQSTEKYLSRFGSLKGKRQTYAAMLSAMDDAVGRVLDTIRLNGLDNDTLIFFVSDNGGPTLETTSKNDPLRGGKAQPYEGGIRTPALIRWKGHLPAGKVYKKPVISLDIVPTALAAAGVKAPDAKFDGVNLLPYLTGKSIGIPHQTLYWRFGNRYAIRHGDWKYVREGQQPFELFNLADDVGEKNDLSTSKPEKVKELREILKKWDSELMEPLWSAPANLVRKPIE